MSLCLHEKREKTCFRSLSARSIWTPEVTKAKQRLAIRAGDDVVKETQLETEGSLISAQ